MAFIDFKSQGGKAGEFVDFNAPPEKPSASVGGLVKTAMSSALDTVGSAFQGGGELLAAGLNKAGGTEFFRTENPAKLVTDPIRNSMSRGDKAATEDTFKGDITDWSSIELPKTAAGWAHAIAGGFGSLSSMILPGAFVATGARGAMAAGAITGALTTGGAAAEEVRSNVKQVLEQQDHDTLMQNVPAYRLAIAAGMDPGTAKQKVENDSALLATGIAGAFGAAGGAFNAKVLEDIVAKRGLSMLLGKSAETTAGRVAVGAGVGTVAEGLQEGLEKVGQNVGENIGLGRPTFEQATRDTAGDVIIGGMIGAATGGAAGAITRPAERAAKQHEADTAAIVTGITQAGSVDQAIAAAATESPLFFDRFGALEALDRAAGTVGGSSLQGESLPYDYTTRQTMYPALPGPDTPTGSGVLVGQDGTLRPETSGDAANRRNAGFNAAASMRDETLGRQTPRGEPGMPPRAVTQTPISGLLPAPDMETGRPIMVNDGEFTRPEQYRDAETARNFTQGERERAQFDRDYGKRAPITLDERGRIVEVPEEYRVAILSMPTIQRRHAAEAAHAFDIDPVRTEAVLADPNIGTTEEAVVFKEIINGQQTSTQGTADAGGAQVVGKDTGNAAQSEAKGLEVEFDGKRYPVTSIQEASEKWTQFRQQSDAGVSDVGNGVPVFENGKQVARISYNGRMWDMADNEIGVNPAKAGEISGLSSLPAAEKARLPSANSIQNPEQAPSTGHFSAGEQAFKEGKPRILPSYFTKASGKNAKDWYRGWDSANVAAITPETKQPETVGGQGSPADGESKQKEVGLNERARSTIDELNDDDWVGVIGRVDGPARVGAKNEEITADDARLLRKMVIKTIKDGLKAGKSREQIVQQIESLTKGGIANAGMNRINALLDAEAEAKKQALSGEIAKIKATKKSDPQSTAPEHAAVGVDDRELGQIVKEFNDAMESGKDVRETVTHIFDAPKKGEIVRLGEKAGVTEKNVNSKRVYNREAGWMTVAEAKARIDEWKAHAASQGETRANADRIVLSLFDLTGKWSQPWEEAGYQVYRFDIQDDWTYQEENQETGDVEEKRAGDVNNFGVDFFEQMFGTFEGNDVYAILAACPCTDFAGSGAKHFAAKDADGRTVASVKLVHQTLATIEYFKPAVWALENPVGRIESLGGLPPWRLSFDPYHLGDTYTKKTLIWGRFNADLPIAPVDPVEGSKMFSQYGGKSLATKNARSATPEGFAYGFFMANNAIDNPVMAVANKYDRLDRDLIKQALDSGVTEQQISEAVDDFYYQDLDDVGANDAIRDLIEPATPPNAEKPTPTEDIELTVQSLRPGAKPETIKVKADPAKSAEQMRAEADLMSGLADLADIFGKNTKLNMMDPEQEQKLLPVLTKVFDAAFRLGHIKFKQAAKFVLDTIRAKLGADIADALTLEHLQGAYIGMSGRYKAQGAEGIAAVSGVADKAAIENSAEEAQNDAKAKEALNDEQDDKPAVGARNPRTGGSTRGKRGASSQQPDAQLDFGNLEAGQPENVGTPEGGQSGGTSGEGVAGENVGSPAGSTGRGATGNGRTGTGRGGNPDAGTGGRGRRPASGPRSDAAELTSPAAPPSGDFVISDPLKIVGGGQVARFEKNKAAIELRNRLTEEGRKPTPEEQETLAGYTGWGSFGQDLFQGTWEKPAPKAGWEKRDQWLRDNLGQNEWEGMQRSIINAHYTDPPTVLAMWDMVKRMGFKGGRVLEPSIGSGNFFGMMPVDLTGRSQRAGIELDPMTGSIAQMLYPNANIQIKGYEASTTPDNFYDLVIGNWPFSEVSPADRRYNRLSPTLHDYFFLKAIDQTKPGGLIVGITTKGTMDKKGVGARMEMARKAELIAAFRLPSGAFEEYAGTAVVTDIIILRKRDAPIGMVDKEGWIDVNDHPTKEGTKVPVNEYFHKNPSHVIGEIDFGHGTTTFRPGLIVRRPNDMMEQLRRIVSLVPEGVFTAAAPTKHISYVANHTSDRTNALVKTDKGLFIVNGEYLAPANEVVKYELKDPAKTAAREKELDSLIDMRKLYGRLIDAERTGNAEAERKELRTAYEAFKKAHGTLSDSFGLGYLRKIDDPFYPSLASLEIRGADDKYRPAGILTASTMRGAKQIDKPTVSDAFVLARNSAVNPTVEQIAEIAKVDPAEAKEQLIASGAAFELPNGDFSPSDIYLSGNVRAKMREARASMEAGNREMERNVAALEKVIPADVPYYKIETQMGATWVPASTYADYIAHMLGMENTTGIDVSFQGGAWKVEFDSKLNNRPQAQSGFGHPHRKAAFKKLVRAAIANQTINIKEKDSDGNEYVNEPVTKEVNAKISEMRLKFGEWLWSDPTRRVALETEYNEVRNAYATPSFDGSFLGFQGMALSLGKGPFNLRQHQVNAIWRALVTRKSLNAHEVGTGKTFTMGGIAVESRRYGIAKKPMMFAHNANSKSVAHEIQMMYPGAKVLYIDNLSKDNIKVRMRQIANDDWDVVVLPHSMIDRIGFKEETLMAMAKEEIDDLMAAAEEAAQDDNVTISPEMWEDEKELAKLRSPTAKQLVKSRMKIIESIKKLSHRASQEDAIPFEDMGVDMLLVDEAHEFKKPPIATKMRMKGLQTATSNRSIAMMFLTRYVRGMNNGGNVHLFTGTPITNTMTEVFHMMRYMMLEEMQEGALADWDGWFGSFAREVNDVELNPAGEYEAVTRLQSFINVPELRRMIGQYMDVVFAEDMPEMQLRLVDGKRLTDKGLTEKQRANILNGRTIDAADRPYKKVVNENSDMTQEQNAVFQQVQAWARSWRTMSKKNRKDAMNRGAPESPIIHEGIAAKASFDVRLVDAIKNAGKEGSDEMAPNPGSKPARVANNLLEIYRSDPNANQVVFMEQGIAKFVKRKEGPVGARRDVRYPAFSTAHDMIERLVASGIPREQIALVDGSTSKDKRKEVADAMNSGKIRIVFGSTDSLGVGVNMQRNLRAMHHMDAPWMPGELEQRNGRGHRQGNQWNTVMEYRYLTDRLDGRRWQVLAIKQRFITDFMKSKGEARVIEGDAASDEGGDILSTFSEAAGDPRVLLREKYKGKLEQLNSRERMHTQAMVDARRTVAAARNSVAYYQERLDKLRGSGTIAKLQKVIESTAGDAFAIEIGKSNYANRAEAHDALEKWLEKNVRMGDEKEVGEFGGEPLYAKWSNIQSKPSLYMRFGNDVDVWANPTVGSLESNLRHHRKTIETDLEKNISDAEARAGHAEKVASEPFHMGDELRAAEKRLSDLVADLEKNPVAAPYWLRAGAPSDTEVFRNGNAYIVTGHRWSGDGWFVLAKDGKGETAIPYLEATDSQNMPLYEEREFEAPTVQQAPAGTAAPAAPANDNQDPDDGPMASRSRVNTDDRLVSLFSDLAASDEAFQYPDTKERGLPDVMKVVDPTAEVSDYTDGIDASEGGTYENVTRAWKIDTPRMATRAGTHFNPFALVLANDKRKQVWVDLSQLKNGERGMAIYQAVATWAYNNGYTFIGDPGGLSKNALYRRTAAMLSSALRMGTTKHLMPHKRQTNPDVKGIRALDWRVGDDAQNLREMLLTEYDNALKVFPELANYELDFGTGKFTRNGSEKVRTQAELLGDILTSEGVGAERRRSVERDVQGGDKPLLDGRATAGEDFETLARALREAYDRIWTGFDKGAYTPPLGLRAFKRAVIVQSVLRREGQEAGRGILDRLSQKLLQRVGESEKPFYRRGGANAAGLTAKQARAELVKAFGTRGIANLERDGILWIGNYADAPKSLTSKLQGNEEGAYWNGRGYIFADNLAAGQAPSVLLHEVGEHFGLGEMLGEAGYARVIKQVQGLKDAGNPAIVAAWNHVKRHYDDAEGSTRFMHEVIAKAGQDGKVQQMGWWKKLMASLKAFLIRTGFKEVSGQADLEALLYAGLQKAMRDAGEVIAAKKGESIHAQIFNRLTEEMPEMLNDEFAGNTDFGFVDQKGKYYTRNQASAILGREAQGETLDAPMASRGNSTPRDMWDLAKSAETPAQARNMALEMLDDPNQLSLWDKTLGTQLNKARKNKYFRKVFDVLQRQQDDVAAFAIEAEAEAVDVLARMGDSKEIASSLKASLSGQRAKDLDVVSKAIFSKIAGVEGVNQKVYSDEELAGEFGMNERQIGMYRQSRDAIDRSLDRYAQSVAVKIAQQYVGTDDLRRSTLDDSVDALGDRLRARIEVLESMVDEDPGEILRSLTIDERGETRQNYVRVKPEEANDALTDEIKGLKAAIKKIEDLQEQAQNLKDSGYAPAMRFGNYSVTARSYDPRTGEYTVEYFGMSDTKTGANVTKMMLKKDHPGWEFVVSPVDKESFKLFRGISPDTVELFARFMDVEQDAAFKEYIALATSSRSAMKRMLERKGVAGFSDNLPRVLSAFITSNSRAAAENMNGFDINEALEEIPQSQGDVSAEAAKLVDYLRNPTDDGAKIRGFMFAYFMGGSVASALVNITQPVMMTVPFLSQFAGLKTGKIVAKAGKMAATGKVEGRDLKAAFDRAEAEGVTDAHEYHQLMQEAEGGGSIVGRAAMKSWGAMFGAAEKFNRRTTFLAAFEVAQGMTREQMRRAGYENAYDFAKGAVAETQGIYNKANRPNWARGPVGALLLTFKQFSIAYLEFFNRLPMQQKMLALGLLVLAAGLEGLPFAEDLEDLIDTIGQKLGYATNSKKALRKAAVSMVGEAGAEFALRGLSGLSGVPMDVSGRLGMGNLVPGTRLFNPSAQDKGREMAEVLGAAGGVAQKAMSAVDQGKVREAMPKAMSDAAKAFEMITTGEYRDSKGRKVITTGPVDAAMKLIGFQPRDVADASRKIGEQMRDSDTVKRVESEIVDQWADGVRNKKPEQVQEARDRLKKWNEDNPDLPIRIKFTQVANRIKFANMTRDQRFQKTLTPEMRSQILRERLAA